MKQHPKTWWYRILEKVWPSRCREIPEALETDRVLIRQFAIWKERIYLQQFASGEDLRYYHSHPWRWGTLAIGLWGSLLDREYAGVWRTRRVRAPYFRYMRPNHVHQTLMPSKGHTSIFIGLGKKTDEKFYWRHAPKRIPWRTHIKKLVKRL